MEVSNKGCVSTSRDFATEYLSEVGVTDEDLIDVYRSYGGTVLGLELLRRSSPTVSLVVPEDVVVPLGDVLTMEAQELVERLPPGLRRGFAIKYSGHGESFSPHCVRGRYSSRRRFWDGQDQARAVRLVREAVTNAPPRTRALAFQEYINRSGLSGVFYAHVHQERVLVEALSLHRRSFTEVHAGRVTRRAEVSGPHIRSGSSQEADVLALYPHLAKLRAALGFDFDLEGFQAEADGAVIAVQLRPIPSDAPPPDPTRQLPTEVGADWHETPLVWGSWAGTAVVDQDLPGRPAVMIKRAASLEDCPTIMRRLRRGDSTLVVDIVDGFRLSHDPRTLPAVVPHRRLFSYISVAGTPLQHLQAGDIVEVVSNGDTGMIRQVSLEAT